MTTLKIKPVKGFTVLDPESRKPLAGAGEEKPRSEYWLRRLAEGVVVEVKTIKTTEEPTA